MKECCNERKKKINEKRKWEIKINLRKEREREREKISGKEEISDMAWHAYWTRKKFMSTT